MEISHSELGSNVEFNLEGGYLVKILIAEG